MNEKNDLFGKKHATLWRISMWASGLAPIVFFIYILFGFWKISQYNQIAHTQHNTDLFGLFSQNPVYILDVLIQMGREFLVGAIIYLALKGISLAFDMIVETDINYREKSTEENIPQSWEVKLLGNGTQPELYNTLEVLKYRKNVNKAIIAVIAVYIIMGLLNFEFVRLFLQGLPLSFPEIRPSVVNVITTIIAIGIDIAIICFPLKALSHILRILMEMEFNSRKAKS